MREGDEPVVRLRRRACRARRRRRRLAPWLRDEPLPLGVALEEEVESRLEDGLLGCSGMRVGERVARGVELAEELARYGDVHAAQVGGLRLDHGRRSAG